MHQGLKVLSLGRFGLECQCLKLWSMRGDDAGVLLGAWKRADVRPPACRGTGAQGAGSPG